MSILKRASNVALYPGTLRIMNQFFNVVYKKDKHVMYWDKLGQFENWKEALLIITPGQCDCPTQTGRRCPHKYKVLLPILPCFRCWSLCLEHQYRQKRLIHWAMRTGDFLSWGCDIGSNNSTSHLSSSLHFAKHIYGVCWIMNYLVYRLIEGNVLGAEGHWLFYF